MKKIKWGQVLSFLLMIALGGVVGAAAAHWAMTSADGDLMGYLSLLIVALLGVYLAFFLQTILHEAGHLICGLMTGYRFVSFRIGSFMWEKGADGKLRFCRFSLAGTGGQCLLAPPDLINGRCPFVFYNLGGCLMNLLTGALTAVLALLLPEGSALVPFCWAMSLVGALFAVLNGVPMHVGGVDNDGRNILSVSRSSAALRAFWLQMKINEQQSLGLRLKDMPEEWFTPSAEADQGNAIIGSIDVMAMSRLMDAQDFQAAQAAGKALLARRAGLLGLYRSLIAIDLAYLELIAHQPGEMAEALQSKETQKFMKAMKNYPTVLRTQYAAALLMDHDAAKAEEIRRKFDRIAANYPHPCEIEGERELMEAAVCASR